MSAKKKLLVTGGAGFIGVNFVRYWLDKYSDTKIAVLDALTYTGNRHSLDGLESRAGFKFVYGDIRDQDLVEKLLRDNDLNTIVHFAAESHVDRSIHEPDAFIETNIIGTHSLLKAAKKVWGKHDFENCRFLHVSTDEVYGSLQPDDALFTEDHPYKPNSPYAASKAASDHLVRAYNKTYGLPVSISNCSNNYGPYQFPEKLIPLFLINALHCRPLPLYGDGLQVRDWLHVSDHCAALDLILAKGETGRVYNVGGNSECDNRSLVTRLCEALDEAFAENPALAEKYPDAPVPKGGQSVDLLQTVMDRPGHDRRYAIDSKRIKKDFGFSPSTGLDTGLCQTVDWYLNNEAWWRQVMDGSYQDGSKPNTRRRAFRSDNVFHRSRESM